MRLVFRLISGLFLILLTGCGMVRNTPKYNFADGFYSAHVPGEGRTRFYVNHTNDSISLYRVAGRHDGKLQYEGAINTSAAVADSVLPARYFRQVSFDIDFFDHSL